MEKYRIYEVTSIKIKSGKGAGVAEWWRKMGKTTFEGYPGTKSVKVYGVQFGLGGEYQLEIWREIDKYGSYDRLDEDMAHHPDKYAAFDQAREVLEFGPTRLMGEWPQSQFVPPEE